MRRAHPSKRVLLFLATFLCAGGSLSVRRADAARATGVRSTGLISDRRQVPSDPLAGLPEEEAGQSGHGRDKERNSQAAHGRDAGGRATCKIVVGPESDREVGDLRAAVAVIQTGPSTWPCTSAQTANPLRLRLSIDSAGKITLVERLSGDQKLGDHLVRRLAGQVSLSKVAAVTTGVARILVIRRRGDN